jgi:type I restriction enzyme M protein
MSTSENILETDQSASAVADGTVLDYITGKQVKGSAKEEVRQRIARALFHEYGIAIDDMEPDFPIKINGRSKKVDIAIFDPGTEHTAEHLRRAVVCRPEPKNGKKGATKMRDHNQAQKDLEELKTIMEHVERCAYGLWTNGLDLFFLRKDSGRFETTFTPVGDWPLGDETMGSRDVASNAYARRAHPDMLRIAFRRCHNFIHGNEGMPKDAAFWQFLYLIFSKMHDERVNRGLRQFWAGPTEQFDSEGRKAIRARITPLFEQVKATYPTIFRGNEEITLSDRALAFMVSELSKYDLTRTDVDAKGAAYQEIVGTNLRGDKGQYFTPRGAIKLVVEMLDPKPTDRVLDPACGTGGFLVATLVHIVEKFRKEENIQPEIESTEEFLSIQERLRNYTSQQIFGADFDPFLVRAAQMNMVMAGNEMGHLYYMNSLEFPDGELPGVEPATKEIPIGSMDLVMTNPPFGSEIPITDPHILRKYDLGHIWERTGDGGFRNTGRPQGSMAPEILFIERCLKWLKPGGRMGIVLPDGILGNPGDEYIRWWILHHAWVLASIDLPVEAFIVEANVNILTSLLFLKRKSDDEMYAESLGGSVDYPVFMAVAENVGYDRRGKTLYKRHPDGEEIVILEDATERIRIGNRVVESRVKRQKKIVNDDLQEIKEKYIAFRLIYKEPGI